MEARLGPLTQGVVVAGRDAGRRPLKRSAVTLAVLIIALGSWWALERSALSPRLGVAAALADTPPATPSNGPEPQESRPPDPQCERALAVVARAGLQLQVTTEFRCPGNTQTYPADRQHSGVACWHHRNYCPEGSYIAINPAHIGKGEDRMHYVIAHEICHIKHYLVDGTPGTEAQADACAAAAGFPR